MEKKHSLDYFLKSDSFINYVLGVESDWNPSPAFLEANKEVIEIATEILCAPFGVESELSAEEQQQMKHGIMNSIAE